LGEKRGEKKTRQRGRSLNSGGKKKGAVRKTHFSAAGAFEFLKKLKKILKEEKKLKKALNKKKSTRALGRGDFGGRSFKKGRVRSV